MSTKTYKPKSKMSRKELCKHVKTLKNLTSERSQYIKSRTKLTNQLKALCRNALDIPPKKEASSDDVKFVIGEVLKKNLPGPAAAAPALGFARESINKPLREVEKKIEAEVRQLPIWTDWAENIRGIGPIGLGIIIGGSVCDATEDPITHKKRRPFITIGDYKNPAKLYKRWGVGLVEGERQQRIAGTREEKEHFQKTGVATGGVLKALRHGFSPTRRAALFVQGDVFVKAGNYYRKRYDQEKARQLKLYPKVFENKSGKTMKKNYALSRAHNRAMRKVTKLFLTDLWNKWRELHGGGEFHKSEDRY